MISGLERMMQRARSLLSGTEVPVLEREGWQSDQTISLRRKAGSRHTKKQGELKVSPTQELKEVGVKLDTWKEPIGYPENRNMI